MQHAGQLQMEKTWLQVSVFPMWLKKVKSIFYLNAMILRENINEAL